MKVLLILGLLSCAATTLAQDRTATTFYLAGAVSDTVTTWRNANAGHPETDPLYHFTKDQPIGMVISLAVTDAVTLWLAHRYAPTHPRLVKVSLFALGGIRATQAVRNAHGWYLDTHQPVFIPDPH